MLWALALLALLRLCSSGSCETFSETCDHQSALQVRNVTAANVPQTEGFPEQELSDVYFASEEPRHGENESHIRLSSVESSAKPWRIIA